MKQELTKKCRYLDIAVKQRKDERKMGILDNSGTAGYENMGCYVCNGYKIKCRCYTIK